MTDNEALADVILRGGTIIDGTGQPRFRGDIAVKNGKIAAKTHLFLPKIEK